MIHTTVNKVLIDSGLCIIQVLTNLRRVGVFTAAVIKKHKYWPRHFTVQEINNYTKTKDIEDFASLRDKPDEYTTMMFLQEGTGVYYEVDVYIWWSDREERAEILQTSL